MKKVVEEEVITSKTIKEEDEKILKYIYRLLQILSSTNLKEDNYNYTVNKKITKKSTSSKTRYEESYIIEGTIDNNQYKGELSFRLDEIKLEEKAHDNNTSSILEIINEEKSVLYSLKKDRKTMGFKYFPIFILEYKKTDLNKRVPLLIEYTSLREKTEEEKTKMILDAHCTNRKILKTELDGQMTFILNNKFNNEEICSSTCNVQEETFSYLEVIETEGTLVKYIDENGQFSFGTLEEKVKRIKP